MSYLLMETSKIYIEEFDQQDDPIFISKVLTPFAMDIYNDLKMRAGKNAIGIPRSMWLDYSRLPEVVAMRLFLVFNEKKDDALSSSDFITLLTTVFLGDLNQKLEMTFKMFKMEGMNTITEEMCKHILQHCHFEGIMEDTEVEGE